MSFLDYHLFVNLLKFCDKSHLFPLLLTSKWIKDLTWRHLIDFLNIDLNELYAESCMDGNLEIVKFLLQDSRVEPDYHDNETVYLASKYGHSEIVKFLLKNPDIDPSYGNNEPIAYSSYLGHIEVVRVLLEDSRVDPNADENEAIVSASNRGHIKIVKLFLKDYRIDEETKEFYRKKHNLFE